MSAHAGPVEPRFWSKVDRVMGRDDSCWLWRAKRDAAGYGHFWLDRHDALAHRVAYRLYVGEIPDGLEIDHLCRNKSCVNPSHLEPVSAKENLRRAPNQITTINAAKTHCKRGHALTSDNLVPNKLGLRHCRQCHRGHQAATELRMGRTPTPELIALAGVVGKGGGSGMPGILSSTWDGGA